jgi:hypothetical protein
MSRKRAWPFADPKNAIALTMREVADGANPILLVTHDLEDGVWQFLDGRDDPDPDDAIVVCLEHMYGVDPTVGQLADLPLGWRAWRDAPNEPWKREEMKPEADGEAE